MPLVSSRCSVLFKILQDSRLAEYARCIYFKCDGACLHMADDIGYAPGRHRRFSRGGRASRFIPKSHYEYKPIHPRVKDEPWNGLEGLVIPYLPNLAFLNLDLEYSDVCQPFRDIFMSGEEFVQLFPQLRHFDITLRNKKGIDNAKILTVVLGFAALPSMRYLILRGLQLSKGFTWLYLAGAASESAFRSLLGGFPRLEFLDMEHCSPFGVGYKNCRTRLGAMIETLTKEVPHTLKHLKLGGFPSYV